MDGTYISPAAQPFRRVMAHLLGMRSVGITVTATAMQNSGYVRYNSDEIKLLDRTGLEGRACYCNIRAVTSSQLFPGPQLFGGVTCFFMRLTK